MHMITSFDLFDCLILVDRVQEAEKEVSHMLLKSIGKQYCILTALYFNNMPIVEL